jgi:hypothetical protein
MTNRKIKKSRRKASNRLDKQPVIEPIAETPVEKSAIDEHSANGFGVNLSRPFTQRMPQEALWLLGIALVAAFYLVLKMFAMNAYSGDEYIYLYQSKLIADGLAPYADFSMAHPPLQMLFTAILFKLFGYHFLLGRLLPVLFCLVAGLVLAVMVRKELGRTASVAAMALYLLSYEPLRASSHYTGVNMTVALLVGAVFACRSNAIRLAAGLCVAAVFTRLYAIPGVIVLVVCLIVAKPRQARRFIGWGAALGFGFFLIVVLWTGFDNFVHDVFLYQASKTPMKPGELVDMRDDVLFHNASIAILFLLAQFAVIAAVDSSYRETDPRLTLFIRLRTAIEKSHMGLVILSTVIALFFLVILLNMNRVWMYYFVPSFPFAAVVGGWLISLWLRGAVPIVRALISGSIREHWAGSLGGAILFGCFICCFLLSSRLEANLEYYKKAINRDASERVSRYVWRPGLLPDFLNRWVHATLWRDERVIGDPYGAFTYLLWHESRVLNIVDDVVTEIQAETSQHGEIFGDSGTAPLFALLSGKRIAGNEVDTNLQRYRSGSADPKEMVRKIDKPTTELVIIQDRFGVAGLSELQGLLREKYRKIKTFRTNEKKLFTMYKRL